MYSLSEEQGLHCWLSWLKMPCEVPTVELTRLWPSGQLLRVYLWSPPRAHAPTIGPLAVQVASFSAVKQVPSVHSAPRGQLKHVALPSSSSAQ
eukprot:1811991-Rhodomonas_salina.4